jgi:hypothetical protein
LWHFRVVRDITVVRVVRVIRAVRIVRVICVMSFIIRIDCCGVKFLCANHLGSVGF